MDKRQLATGPCPELHESSPHLQPTSLKIHFNILPSTDNGVHTEGCRANLILVNTGTT